MITAKQAGMLLGLSAGAVYELARGGKLTYYRLAKSAVRFDEADVEAYKAACRVPARPRPASEPVSIRRLAANTVRLRVSDPSGETSLVRYFKSQGYIFDGTIFRRPPKPKKGA